MTFSEWVPAHPIEDHPDYPSILKTIEEWGDKPKGLIVSAVYDESGESLTRTELRQLSRGKLLAMLIDQFCAEGGLG